MKLIQSTCIAVALVGSSSAENIKQQDFDAVIFSTGAESGSIYFNRTGGLAVKHTSAGGADLGFTHDGQVSITAGGTAGVVGGQFQLIHYSSNSEGSDLYNADNTFFNNNPRNSDLIFDVVNLKAHTTKHFSMDLGELGSLGSDDDIYIRLKINGVDQVIFDTRAGASGTLDASDAKNGATYSGTTLRYSFLDTDESAQLMCDILLDDADDGYSFDNITFEGAPIPVVASQDFEADLFKSISEGAPVDGAESGDVYFNGGDATHASTGNMDMGFVHDGLVSQTQGGTSGVVGGAFHIIHYSSNSNRSSLDFGNSCTGEFHFEPLDLSGYTQKTFSMDVGDLGSLGNDDDVVVRLQINGTDNITLLDTRSQSNGTTGGVTLTYPLGNIQTSVQLLIDVLSDDAGDGYSFDNIVFKGVSNPGAPVFSSSQFTRPDAFAILDYSESISASATDPNGDTLSYGIFSGPAWLVMASDGSLSGSPGLADLGVNEFRVYVNDGNGGSDIARFVIEVKDSSGNPGAPSFSVDPVNLADGRATEAYAGSLAGWVSDPTGDPLRFGKLSGPDWLVLDPVSGAVFGTPPLEDRGLNEFEIYVTDDQHGAHVVKVVIQVNDPDGTYYPNPSDTEHYRLVWDNDPSSTMTVAWKQISGSSGTVYYGKQDFGRDYVSYPHQKTVDSVGAYRGGEILSCFARLTGLDSDTAYYFVIKDETGVSQRYWFLTAPSTPKAFTFIAGGDSRTYHTPRRRANRMVAKLRPLFVSFTGDMIESDDAESWNTWFEHWQETISSDARMYPIIPHRGNHEYGGNNNFFALFDTSAENYYAFSVAGNLLRFYVLNSETQEGGDQATWLSNDLAANAASHTHLAGGYHKPMRPHISSKSEGSSEYDAWAQLFYDHGMNLIFEADSHTVKRTYPIKPFTGTGSDEGFIRDDDNSDGDGKNGTVFAGEGSWGAPLRDANDTKAWTMASDKFNGFDWIHVYPSYMELYTVKVDNADSVGELEEGDVFSLPSNIDLWSPTTGTRLVINDQNPTTLLSFTQWQLDQWGVSTTPVNARALDDFDGDGLDNMTEFSFGLDPQRIEVRPENIFPVMALNGDGETKMDYRRRSNTALSYRYEYSYDLITWESLIGGVGNDYTETITPDGSNERVTIHLLGDKAMALKIFIRIHVR